METNFAKSDIVAVMSQYTELTKSGTDYICSCPLCRNVDDKYSPKTCIVSPSNDSFFCMDCGTGGDAVEFLIKKEGLDYDNALGKVSEIAGREMLHNSETQSSNKEDERRRMIELNKEAARYFRDVLISDKGNKGMEYLIGRGITEKTIRKYGLGYSTDNWQDLHTYLNNKGYSDSELEDASLLSRGGSGKLFDKFRNRVMFPIINQDGEVIAFGGRTLSQEDTAKYLNSGETVAFQKRENIFSLNFAKNSDKGYLILCEGYVDVVTLNQAGFTNAIATLGTALTPQQAHLMKQYTDSVVICYDSDEAGQKAALRAIKILSEEGLDLKVLTVENAKDPDEFIKKFGADGFQRLLDNCPSALDYQYYLLEKGIDMSAPEGKYDFIERAREFVASLDNFEKAIFISAIAERTGQNDKAVAAYMNGSKDNAVEMFTDDIKVAVAEKGEYISILVNDDSDAVRAAVRQYKETHQDFEMSKTAVRNKKPTERPDD